MEFVFWNQYVFWGNTAGDWLIALGVALLVAGLLHLVKLVAVRRLAALAARTATLLDDVAVAALSSTKPLVILILGLYAGSTVLELAPRTQLFVTRAALATGLIQVALWADAGLHGWLNRYRRHAADDPARATSAAAIGFIARIALWSVILLMILDNLGFNITTLVASLGIGGIAVALAVQNILGDLFASLSIVLDKPFVIGDFIMVDGVVGTVEYVGLKTTRVRSLGGEQIVFSNADLLNSRIHNMRRMQTRRAVFTLGVTYDTPEPVLREIPSIIERIIGEQENVSFDRAHFSAFNASSLDFEAVYIINTADYRAYMDVKQEIYFRLVKAFNERGIEFAFPTQTLHVVNDTPPARDEERDGGRKEVRDGGGRPPLFAARSPQGDAGG